MNNGFKQNEYKEAMDGLRFSEEAKARMTRRLTAAPQPVQRRTGRKGIRILAVAAAAVLALTIGVGAAGGFQTAGEAFAAVFGAGAAETEIIDKIGRPIGASATDNGVTITADAIIGDKYHYAITFTIEKDDGTAFDGAFDSIEGTNRLPMHFEQSDMTVKGFYGGSHGSSYFYDADPTDNAIQYIALREMDSDVPHGTVKVCFENLIWDGGAEQTVAEGRWELRFDMEFEDTSVSLPAGQSICLNGMDAVIDQITLSPIALRVDYTVDSEIQWSDAPSGQMPEEDREQREKYFQSLQITVNRTDGTSIDLSGAGGSIRKGDGETVCQKGDLFEEIIPLEEIGSVTIAGMEIPVA